MIIAIVYDITGKMISSVESADSGILTGDYTRNPFAIGAGTIAGAAVGNAIGSRWAEQRKEILKRQE